MFKFHRVLTFLFIGLIFIATGCLRPSITDDRISQTVQAFMDSPPDPSNEKALTAEERAVIESFTIYRNTIKVQLVRDTDRSFWEPVGAKMTNSFAYACRDVNFLQSSYFGELYIIAVFDEKDENFLIGKFTFNNSSERITPELYSPSRR